MAMTALSEHLSRMTASGNKRRFRPVSEYDRSTPESGPSSGNVRFLGVEVRLYEALAVKVVLFFVACSSLPLPLVTPLFPGRILR